MLIPGENDNISDDFRFYKDEKFILEQQKIENDYRNAISENLDIKSHMRNILSGYTSQNRLFKNELLLSLREVRFSE